MKNITDFIFNKHNNQLYMFEEDFKKHLEIEHIYSYDLLFETAGLFDGCNELVNFIINFLSKELTKNENKVFFKSKELIFEITNFINENVLNKGNLLETLSNPIIEKNEIYTFFNKLVLKIYLSTDDIISPSYEPKNNYNKETDKLDECILIIDLPKNKKFNFYSNQVKKFLTHELTHAYEDYNRQRKQNVETLKDILSKNTYKEGIKRIKSKDGIEQFIGKYIYCTNKQEQNAYLAEFNTVLDERFNEINKSKNLVNQLFDIIKNTEIYKTYYEVGSIIELLEQHKIDNIIPLITNEYNSAFNSSLSETQVIKTLSNNWYKVKKKFETQIPKIVYKYLTAHNL